MSSCILCRFSSPCGSSSCGDRERFRGDVGEASAAGDSCLTSVLTSGPGDSSKQLATEKLQQRRVGRIEMRSPNRDRPGPDWSGRPGFRRAVEFALSLPAGHLLVGSSCDRAAATAALTASRDAATSSMSPIPQNHGYSIIRRAMGTLLHGTATAGRVVVTGGRGEMVVEVGENLVQAPISMPLFLAPAITIRAIHNWRPAIRDQKNLTPPRLLRHLRSSYKLVKKTPTGW